EQQKLKNVSAIYTNAKHIGFKAGSFDLAICGFMAWDDCFDFTRGEFTQPDTKAKGIWRVLRDGGRFVCCSWEKQEGVSWMEEAVIRHYPAILENDEYLKRRPIGMAYEKAAGYEIILQSAGFREIEVFKEAMTFVSTDEEEWWRQMLQIGWGSFLERGENNVADKIKRIKEAIKCNKRMMFKEYLKRGPKIKTFSRAMIEFEHDVFQLLGSHSRQVAVLGNILSYQAIHILITAAFPGGIGMGKKEIDTKFSCDALMLRKLFAVVPCNGVPLTTQRLK
ncbi:MAG: hypothetical protein AMJ53_10405, partial [Gammaproteobacteria bacterium SG8_11]